jgi:hypothetical protein
MKDFIDYMIPPLVSYLDRDLVGNGKKVLGLMKTTGMFSVQKKGIQNLYSHLNDPENPYTRALRNLKQELNENVRKKLLGEQ